MSTPLHDAVAEVLLKNRRTKDGYQYTVPSPSSYPYQWLWDSCFHAIMLSHLEFDAAKAELRALVSKQFPSGQIPHMLYWEPQEVMAVDWGVPDTSSLTQPPLLAYATWRTFAASGDHAFLEELYPAIVRFHEYLLTRVRPEVGLIGIINPDESGEDNSPRFDRALALPAQHPVEHNSQKRFALFDEHRTCAYLAYPCTATHFWVEDVAFNSYFVWNCQVLADIAHELGDTTASAHWRGVAKRVGQAMREHLLFNGEFKTLSSPDFLPIEIKTWAMFAPLLADLYTKDEAAVLIETHLKDPTSFDAPFGVPTVALDEPSYDPYEPSWGKAWQHPHWRGPIWMAPHWFLHKGLTRYGYTDLAATLKQKSVSLIEKSGFREYFDPMTGEGMGAEDFTWGGLVIDME